MAKWTTDNIPDLGGKIAVVTGANSGIGFFTAFWLAVKGARVIIAARNLHKVDNALQEMRARQSGLMLDMIPLDLASLESIHDFVTVFQERYSILDILINNAGVMAIPFLRTADGFEMQFGTNHLGHFALTGLLLPLLKVAPAGRVVTVSSMMHLSVRMDFDNLNGENSYNKENAYGQSKLANLLFAYELQRRLTDNGLQTISLGTNPGYAATNLQRVGPQLEGNKRAERMLTWMNRLFAQSAEKSALTSLFAATSPEARGGDYIQPQWFTAWGYPNRSNSSQPSYNEADAARLWQISEQMTGVEFFDRQPKTGHPYNYL